MPHISTYKYLVKDNFVSQFLISKLVFEAIITLKIAVKLDFVHMSF